MILKIQEERVWTTGETFWSGFGWGAGRISAGGQRRRLGGGLDGGGGLLRRYAGGDAPAADPHGFRGAPVLSP